MCGYPTVIKTEFLSSILYCQNPQCSGLLVNRLDYFCGKQGLDIKGLSKSTLGKLIDWGWINSVSDIFNLNKYEKEWIKKPGFGVVSVNKILKTIEDKSQNCDLVQFISALGIPNTGLSASKDLVKRFKTWANFIKAVDTDFKFNSIPNFGPEMHKAIKRFDFTEAKALVANVIKFNEVAETTNTLEGKTIVITGKVTQYKNRDELKAVIESLGGTVANSVTKNTSYLINNDVTSNSSKNLKAKELNIPIISEKDFQKILTK